jgi:hypothetical protein
MFANSGQIRGILNEVVNQYQIGTIADVGCGDQNWVHDSLPDSVEYQGFDVKPRYVDTIPFDVAREVLPGGYDLILCICVINHLSDEMAARAWRLLRESGNRMILCSYMKGHGPGPGYELLRQWTHESTDERQAEKKRQLGRVWKYGLWRMNDA